MTINNYNSQAMDAIAHASKSVLTRVSGFANQNDIGSNLGIQTLVALVALAIITKPSEMPTLSTNFLIRTIVPVVLSVGAFTLSNTVKTPEDETPLSKTDKVRLALPSILLIASLATVILVKQELLTSSALKQAGQVMGTSVAMNLVGAFSSKFIKDESKKDLDRANESRMAVADKIQAVRDVVADDSKAAIAAAAGSDDHALHGALHTLLVVPAPEDT